MTKEVTPGKVIWARKCGQCASGSAKGRWRWQHKTERGGGKWYVAYDTLKVKNDKA